MKPFTFEELWKWDSKLNNIETRQQAINEATLERGYHYHQFTDKDNVERWELSESENVKPCATGHFV